MAWPRLSASHGHSGAVSFSNTLGRSVYWLQAHVVCIGISLSRFFRLAHGLTGSAIAMLNSFDTSGCLWRAVKCAKLSLVLLRTLHITYLEHFAAFGSSVSLDDGCRSCHAHHQRFTHAATSPSASRPSSQMMFVMTTSAERIRTDPLLHMGAFRAGSPSRKAPSLYVRLVSNPCPGIAFRRHLHMSCMQVVS